jgi:hypothetical protein
MFCVILAALLSSVSTISTIKPLPSEDSGIAAPLLTCHYGWTLWCILYSLSTYLTKQTQTTASSTRHHELLDVLQHQQSSKD